MGGEMSGPGSLDEGSAFSGTPRTATLTPTLIHRLLSAYLSHTLSLSSRTYPLAHISTILNISLSYKALFIFSLITQMDHTRAGKNTLPSAPDPRVTLAHLIWEIPPEQAPRIHRHGGAIHVSSHRAVDTVPRRLCSSILHQAVASINPP